MGLATLTIDQLKPGTWASQAGRLAIRIIELFYISRVLAEVCVLFINIVAGFFILFENLFLVGDYIEVSGVKGLVEEIGVRVTKLRDDAGVLHAIPNGEVRKVSSHSKGYVNVVIDLLIPYEEDIHKVIGTLDKKTVELRENEAAILGLTDFELEDLRESAVLLRTTTMVKAGTDRELSAVLRPAFLDALAAAGIPAPYARRLLVIAKKSASTPSAQTPPPALLNSAARAGAEHLR